MPSFACPPRRFVRVAASVLAFGLFPGASVRAGGPIVDAGGFEAFNSGATLDGQFGWVTTPGAGSSLIQTATAKSGKAVRIDKAGVDKRWGRVVSGYPTGRFIDIGWDMLVLGTGAGTGNFGPLFGVEAYDGHLPLPTPTRVLGSAFIDSTTGDVVVQAVGGNLIDTGVVVPFNAWHNFRLVVDFTLDKYSVFVNGTKAATIGFVDPGTEFTDADISALAAAADGTSQSRPGTAFFDNFVVRSSIAGDFDDDGDVDATDFTIWKGAFGSTTGGAADSDGDLDSDGADFLAWQRNRGLNAVSATAAGAAVPEPASAVAALVAFAGAAAARRRFAQAA